MFSFFKKILDDPLFCRLAFCMSKAVVKYIGDG